MPQRILAVDDEPHMLLLLDRIISSKTTYPITTTSNSLEIPDLLDSEEFDVIISDLKMPGLDGIDILRLIKEKGLKTEMIIITAFGSLETTMDAMSLGVSGYILKPFKKEQIILAIEQTMELQRIKRDKELFDRLITSEPFDSAVQAFQREYVHRLNQRYSSWEEMSKQSGLSLETITSILDK